MNIYLGIDIGVVSVKAALICPHSSVDKFLGDNGTSCNLRALTVRHENDLSVLLWPVRRTKGQPLAVVRSLIEDLTRHIALSQIDGFTLTGNGSRMLSKILKALRCNDFQAIVRAIDMLHPEVRSVFEMGGENSRYLSVIPDPNSGSLGIVDYSQNGDCAAGTGGFLDQQAGRLKYRVEEIGEVARSAQRCAQIAGRCSVFAKSDMIHAQQKGFNPPEVLQGLCRAVATNYKSAVVKGRHPTAPVAFIGGLSANRAVVDALRDAFGMNEQELFVPDGAEYFGAIGAARFAAEHHAHQSQNWHETLDRLRAPGNWSEKRFPRSASLNLDNVTLLHDRIKPYVFSSNNEKINTFLGLDIGSVGTKLALIDRNGKVIHSIFTRTEGRPIEVVTRCLLELREALGDQINICGVGTTGSGRELIGELVGADSINDEITAHKTGATFIGDHLLGKHPDTIFEIGGQDSKYISLQAEGANSGDTIVTDFTMNEACAAGTGSFLEERAEELGVSIKNEFAELALQSTEPIKLGERCTVFMERDVNTYMQQGAKLEDVIAGLAYSVAYNYINRVVRGRLIGECIFFQGGTAYNNAVAAAFAAITGKEIIVPPHNAVLGAIGAALLAKEKMLATKQPSRFRGYDLGEVDYTLREFTCKGCGNYCQVQEFNVAGEKTFWGDKCSDRYRKQAKTKVKPVIPDLIALRQQLLMADDRGDAQEEARTIGIPLAMYTMELLPLWRRFFRDCGFRVVVSSPTNQQTVRRGLDSVVAEPCFPIVVAHGHVAELVEKNVDYIWLPNIVSAPTKHLDRESYYCPWGQTLPFVIRQASAFRSWAGRILCPTITFRPGIDKSEQVLLELAKELGIKRSVAKDAFDRALVAQHHFYREYLKAGSDALKTLKETGESGMVLVGRPYNIHDAGVNLSVAKKLRDLYGVNVLPIDALPVDDTNVSDVNDNMYWELGRRILAASKIVREYPNLHIIYITNFKCGPDSYVKGFIKPASGKPFLSLQFDGHSNDAGMMTRCEAYLDSKGILRWWRKSKDDVPVTVWPAEPSTSPKWPTPVPA